ncbi:MAG TPA: TonB-dependent receptor plug domain-containing protein, partial [Casimicrobium huifangae]|nr:TonB-dependent receptor plug domain-containing protein [Casimicrobium huifangae]
MKHGKPFLLSPVAIALLAAWGQASAQQPPATPAAPAAPAAAPAAEQPKSSNVVEQVVVTGFRASLESAINKKREDNGIVDVVKAEDIAKFPDTNLAESLQRVPGVVIARDAGEGRNITVRGLGSQFTRVRINGLEALATTGGTDSSGGNNRSRGFDFNVFASELFNSITVRKSSSADVDEGSLGATVDLQSGRPFDYKGLTAVFSAKERYNDLSGTTDPRAAFLLSNTWADGKVGALISGA